MRRTRPPRLACRGQDTTLIIDCTVSGKPAPTNHVEITAFTERFNDAGSMYLDFPEDETIPDGVSPHDAFQHLGLLPLKGKLQHPALQRAVGLPKDL